MPFLDDLYMCISLAHPFYSKRERERERERPKGFDKMVTEEWDQQKVYRQSLILSVGRN